MADETTGMTAEDKRRAKEARIDAAVRAKLTCVGCGGPYLPVAHKQHVSYCCPVPGCSRMVGGMTVTGWVAAIVAVEGILAGGSAVTEARKAIGRYERTLKKTNKKS
jgi:hypothetical protein